MSEEPRPGQPAPRRVRVTSPRRGAAPRPPSRPRAAELDEQTALGEVFALALVRAQCRLAAGALAGTAAIVVIVTAVVFGAPNIEAARVGPIPATWLLVGIVSYVAFVAVALGYGHAADRVEDEFAGLVRDR